MYHKFFHAGYNAALHDCLFALAYANARKDFLCNLEFKKPCTYTTDALNLLDGQISMVTRYQVLDEVSTRIEGMLTHWRGERIKKAQEEFNNA